MSSKVMDLMVQKNNIEAQIWAIEAGLINENGKVLINEILNLLDGVGEQFIEGDYYAPSRYYSVVPGVKNIRLHTTEEGRKFLEIKVTSPAGLLVPDSFLIREERYEVRILRSSKFTEKVDY